MSEEPIEDEFAQYKAEIAAMPRMERMAFARRYRSTLEELEANGTLTVTQQKALDKRRRKQVARLRTVNPPTFPGCIDCSKAGVVCYHPAHVE